MQHNRNRKLRILHLISSNGLYGAERLVIVLSKALKRRKFHPIIGVIRNEYNPHTEIAEDAKACGLDNVIFPCSRQFDPKTIFSIRRYIAEQNIGLVHCHGYKSNFYGLLGSFKRLPKVSTNHNWLTNDWRLKIYCLLDSLWIRHFDQIIAVSDKIKQEMTDKGIPTSKIQVIDNGIDLDRFAHIKQTQKLKKEFSIIDEMIVIGSIGSLNHEKGHIYLLETARMIVTKYPNVKFLIIGDGILRDQLKAKAVEYGLNKKFVFTGFREDIPELLSLMDIFVLPSIKEGLPMVLLEAMAAKTPIVATKVGAVPKVILNDATGILVNPKNSCEIEMGITELIEDPAKAKGLAQNAFSKARNEFSSDILCGKYIEIYNKII